MNTKKFSSVYLLIVLLTGALVLAPTMTGLGANQSEAPDYVTVGTWYDMLQFEVENTNDTYTREFNGISVSYGGDNLDDVAKVALYTGSGQSGTKLDEVTFDSTPKVLEDFTESMNGGETRTYYIAIEMDGSVTDANEVQVSLESLSAEADIEYTGTSLPLASDVSLVDDAAPTFKAAITGDLEDGNSNARNKLYLTFEEVSGLNASTVDAEDFRVADDDSDWSDSDNYTVNTATVDGDGNVVLTLDSDLDTNADPYVTIDDSGSADKITDEAGNTINTGPGDADYTNQAADGLKPQVSGVSYNYNASDEVSELTVTFNEDVGIPGSAGDYEVSYTDPDDVTRSPDVESVSREATDQVLVQIPDQAMKTDPGGDFKVTVSGAGNVYDASTNPNSVDTDNNSETVTVTDFNQADPAFVSATAVNDTTVEIEFDEPIEISGTPDWGSDVTATDLTASDGSVTSDSTLVVTVDSLGDTGYTASDLSISADTVEDQAANTNGSINGKSIADGQSPTMDSAETTAVDTVTVTFSEEIANDSVAADDFDVEGNTVSGVTNGTDTVNLTLETEIATDATPNVTLVSSGSVEDTAGNVLSGEVLIDDTTDGIAPVLESVDWTDVDGNDEVTENDKLTLTFSEPMDQTTIEEGNVNTNFDNDFGTNPVVSWSSDSVVEITLADDEGLSLGTLVDPNTNVLGVDGNNADATTSPVQLATGAVRIESGASYPTIQDAIDNASDGDVIIASAGTYDVGEMDIDKEVTLKSESGASSTTMEVDGYGICVIADNVIVDGFTITASENPTSTGVGLLRIGMSKTNTVHAVDTVSIKNNVFKDFVTSQNTEHHYGVTAGNSDSAKTIKNITITNNEFKNLKTEAEGWWLSAIGTFDDTGGSAPVENLSITDNVVHDISGVSSGNTWAQGIVVGAPSNATVEDNVIYDISGGTLNFGIKVGIHSVDVDLTGNEIYNVDTSGIFLDDGADITENDIHDNAQGIRVFSTDGAESTIKNNNIYGNTDYGLTNDVEDSVTAKNNWWGDISGPSGEGKGSGDAVSSNVDYDPWLNAAYPDGTSVGGMTLSKTFSTSGWHLISFDGEPYNQKPSDLLGVNSGSLFYWEEADNEYAQGDEMGASVSSQRGYWFYVGSDIAGVNGTGVVSSPAAYEIRSTVEIELVNKGWHMISAPFDVSSANVEAKIEEESFEDLTQADDNGWMTNGFWAYTDDTNDDGKADDYDKDMSPGAVLVADMGYWVKTEEDDVTLKITFDPNTRPTQNASMAAMGFEPVPEGDLKPPAPPAAMGESGDLKATAAVTDSGVTFEVAGADVQSMQVQVFSPNGEEVFSGSAAGSSLSWNANVANGVYLYGVSAKVGGEVKPLGIQKLLILE